MPGREHVDPEAPDRLPGAVGEARPTDVDGALGAARDGRDVVLEARRDAQPHGRSRRRCRRPRCRVGAGRRRGAETPPPPSRPLTTSLSVPSPPRLTTRERRRGGGGQLRGVPGVRRERHIDVAKGLAQRFEQGRQLAPVRPRPAPGLAITSGARLRGGSRDPHGRTVSDLRADLRALPPTGIDGGERFSWDGPGAARMSS